MLGIKLFFGWLLTLGLLVGPYLALCIEFWPFHVAYHVLYWVAALTYLGYGFISSVNITSEDLATAAIPNPFSFEDELAQNRILLSLFLLPAIVMAWVMQVTWVLVFGGREG